MASYYGFTVMKDGLHKYIEYNICIYWLIKDDNELDATVSTDLEYKMEINSIFFSYWNQYDQSTIISSTSEII